MSIYFDSLTDFSKKICGFQSFKIHSHSYLFNKDFNILLSKNKQKKNTSLDDNFLGIATGCLAWVPDSQLC
jgi:hypothetical protein